MPLCADYTVLNTLIYFEAEQIETTGYLVTWQLAVNGQQLVCKNTLSRVLP